MNQRGDRVARWTSLLMAMLALSACTGLDGPDGRSIATRTPGDGSAADELLSKGLAAAQANRWQDAQDIFGDLLRDDVRNSRLQFLNGLAYEQLARTSGRDMLELARIGYRNSANFARSNYWAHLHLGFLALESADPAAAQEAFAAAVRDQPQRSEAVLGLGIASYYAGDLYAARLAADKAKELAPDDPQTLRLMAFVLAADGDRAAAEQAVLRYEAAVPGDRFVKRRVSELVRQATLAATEPPLTDDRTLNAAPQEDNQVTVDVAIILSSKLRVESRGINLLDGLSAQYGMSNTLTSTRSNGTPYSSTRLITQGINIPTLTYSLNLFNDSSQFYQVIARPTLTAFIGRESEFFAGRTISVTVSGVNLGSLQPIDVGVNLKVTPEIVEGNRVTFRVAASRSFLSREEIGTFDESLATFRQLVSATAQVEFGQSLLLSALSESVQDANSSRVPVLGEIPGAKLFFNESTNANREESLLILLTPSRPAMLQTSVDGSARPAELESLLQFWKEIVEPRTSLGAITGRLGASKFFKDAQSGDLRWTPLRTPQLATEALEENVALARR